jgi:ParB family chromosome partitioning protein
MTTAGHLELNRAVDSIRVGVRRRQDLGDLQDLIESIRRLGLLQPITISPDGSLICGLRRLRAVEALGWKQVGVWVRSGVSTEMERLLAEQHENELRKPYSPVEAAQLYSELKAYYAEDAARRKEGSQFGGPGKFPGPRGDAREQAAAAIPDAPSYKTMEHLLDVRRAASDERIEPALREVAARELAGIERDGKVDPHYRTFRAAADLSESDVSPLAAVDDLHAVAKAAVARATAARRSRRGTATGTQGPATRRSYGVRSLLLTLQETDSWWSHYDAVEVARDLSVEQWDHFEDWVDHSIEFRDEARRHRRARRTAI